VQPIEQDPRPLADGPLGRGTEIGRFVVLGLIGRGAMGEVYVAHDPELDRKIAIKLLRAEATIDAPAAAVTSRFIREAQAAAKISDPNVVVVYDVGTFAGRVFIAMELIEGHTLTYWLQLKSRAMAEILRIFLAAARGLAAAHERGVIHRDFKPDNVMVTPDGQVRVVDFGLAGFGPDDAGAAAGAGRAASAPTADPLTRSREVPLGLTQKGALLGTPAYMSPEQFQGARADARTDQFSFCVALYEALYRLRPFSGSTLKLLTENVVAGRVRPTVDGSLVPPSIRRALSRGLLPDPDERFPSMRALIEELERETTQLGVRGFAADAEAKLAGIWEAPAQDLATGDAPLTAIKLEIRRAFLATGKPYAAASFDATCRTLDRFAGRWSHIYVECCEATHVRGEQPIDVLDLRMGALNEALAHLRALSGELRRATGDTVENAVRAASALGTLERCNDVDLLRAIIRPPDDPITRACVDELRERLAGVRALAHLGHVAAGLKDVVPLEAEARRLDYKPLLAEVLFTLGTLQYYVGDLASAASATEDAIWTAELCRHDELAAEAAASLVFFAGHAQSRFEAGEIWSRHAENALARMGGHDLIRGWLLNNRGAMRATQGRLHEAVADQLLAIAAKEKALGPEDPDVSLSMSNVAIYLDELGDIASAADYAERAVRIMEATLGLDHPKAAIPLTNYAELLVRLGRNEEALRPAERALAVFERETDPESLFVTYPLSTLGLAYVALGRFEEALPPLERAARIRDAKETAPATRAETHFALARALAGAGRDLERARELALAARDEYRAAPPTPATARHLVEIDRWLDPG
jgi:tetratricopeptide (TPR) repeat protein/tRNA A-37 threonylcarbamoyl transferase component Bud32